MATDIGIHNQVLRFEIELHGGAYRSLVAGLRGRPRSSSSNRSPQHTVMASIDFDPLVKRFAVTHIDHHKLPRLLVVRTGSETHENLAYLLSRAVSQHPDTSLTACLEKIVGACPTVHLDSLRINANDLELLPVQSDTSNTLLSPVLATIGPTVLVDIDDTPTLAISPHSGIDLSVAEDLLRRTLTTTTPIEARTVDNFVEVSTTIRTPVFSDVSIQLFAHWGSYDELSPPWQDELALTISPEYRETTAHLYYRTHVPTRGWHGATFFAQIAGGTERIWLSRSPADNASFYIARDDSSLIQQQYARFVETQHEAATLMKQAAHDYSLLPQAAARVESIAPHVSLGQLVAATLPTDQSDGEMLCTLKAHKGLVEHERLVQHIITTYGIGEVVFASPEGPHATGGGLAQVICGLPPNLCAQGVPVSIIAPLYRYDHGSKHHAATRYLEEGVLMNDTRVVPSYVGSISVQLGPTHVAGTPWNKRSPSTIPFRVYLAQHGNLRLFLLTNASIFDRLYQPVFADEQLRRAITFSRGVLETIATEHFGIRPSVIISNDWLTACVPAFAALDARYMDIPWLRSAKTVHMIHNGGADYHGRLPYNTHDEDLWPMLNLDPEHFFGFRDPHRGDLINFTMAAAHHVTGGILTVSKQYASDLASPLGGDGLECILAHRRDQLYGISNGINRTHIESFLEIISGTPARKLRSVSSLLEAKARTRAVIQSRYGLAVQPQAHILTLVGRLAEQKGLSLLSGFTDHHRRSTLEDILVQHPHTQIIVAGPLTPGDKEAEYLRDALYYLTTCFPGRVTALFEYIQHTAALEIIFGSTLFLMPSRFEPGGITQLEALAAGTPVVGRNVGGISATIHNFDPSTGLGNGFLCNDYNATAFANTLHWALGTIQNPDTYRTIVTQAIEARHDWSDRIPAFLDMLQRVTLGAERASRIRAALAPQAMK